MVERRLQSAKLDIEMGPRQTPVCGGALQGRSRVRKLAESGDRDSRNGPLVGSSTERLLAIAGFSDRQCLRHG